jgi:hypothetical protein
MIFNKAIFMNTRSIRTGCSTTYGSVVAEDQSQSTGLEKVSPELLDAMKRYAVMYRKRYPKASQRELKRATAKAFNIKLQNK